MAVSFYFYTGYRFPVRVSGAGNKSKYVGYDSNDALILPGHQRAAVLQGICLRNVIQNLTTVTGQKDGKVLWLVSLEDLGSRMHSKL